MVKKALRLISILNLSILLLIVVPFNNIYASVQSTIVPTFSSSTSQWNGHLFVTNFSDGTNNQASSTLSFTLDDDYYGIIYFDGYGPSNQHIANYASCYVAGGYGEYRYSYYQNAVINITSVTINIVSVVKPQTTVDLTQIITLLTAIENDTSSIDNVLDTTLAQIRLILNELIESNGYLETLTKLRQYNLPIESWRANYEPLVNKQPKTFQNIQYWNYPVFDLITNQYIIREWNYNQHTSVFIFGTSNNISLQNYSNYLNFTTDGSYELNYSDVLTSRLGNYKFIRLDIKHTSHCTVSIYASQNISDFIYIYLGDLADKNISTDFALQWGLSNRLLDNLELIANGTNASSAASSQSDQANSQLQQDSNTLFTQEDTFKQNMNSAMQNIDTTFSLNNFGSSFMSSAQWVRTQYETLTNNTPFASLITFSLLVGLALIVIGKVYK